MDITYTEDLGHLTVTTKTKVTYPGKVTHNSTLRPLMKLLSKDNMHANLEKFSSFHTRYYKVSACLEDEHD